MDNVEKEDSDEITETEPEDPTHYATEDVLSWLNRFPTTVPIDDTEFQVRTTEGDLRRSLLSQQGEHRAKLLTFLMWMAGASFCFLALVVVAKILIPLFIPSYNAISDTVITVLATGVFAEIIGVIAIVVRAIWKETNSN